MLLRSVAVHPDRRSMGVGGTVVDVATATAASAAVETFHRLMTSASAYFEMRGSKVIDRTTVPDALRRSSEFGGVGMLGGDDLALPYPWIMRNNITLRGQWMCSRDAPTRIVGLVRSGLLALADFEVTAFALADVDAAVAHAAVHGGAFRQTVLTMPGAPT